MSATVIGILEDNPARVERLAEALSSAGIETPLVDHDNAPDFVQWLQDEPRAIEVISLDYDLIESTRYEDHGTGMDVVRAVCAGAASFPVLVHSSSAQHREAMAAALLAGGRIVQRIDLAAGGGYASWADWVRKFTRLRRR